MSIELDNGKWYASTDKSATNAIYSIILDNNENVITDFNPKLEKVINYLHYKSTIEQMNCTQKVRHMV